MLSREAPPATIARNAYIPSRTIASNNAVCGSVISYSSAERCPAVPKKALVVTAKRDDLKTLPASQSVFVVLSPKSQLDSGRHLKRHGILCVGNQTERNTKTYPRTDTFLTQISYLPLPWFSSHITCKWAACQTTVRRNLLRYSNQ